MLHVLNHPAAERNLQEKALESRRFETGGSLKSGAEHVRAYISNNQLIYSRSMYDSSSLPHINTAPHQQSE